MSIRIEVWGPYACFSRPELKVERVSYDVMTASAARGLIESIYWHPGIRWVIDKIYVLNRISFTSIRRNEVSSKISARNVQAVMNGKRATLFLSTSDDIQQRASTVLQNVRYVIEAHFDMTAKASPADNPGKFQDIVRRRLAKGQCYHQPCFGVREFPAHFRPYTGKEIHTVYADTTRDLGYMLYDLDYSDPQNIQPLFIHAVMTDGVLDFRNCEVKR